MPQLIDLDTETFNTVDLKEAGTYRYAETAEVMLLTYSIDEGEPRCIDFTDPDRNPDEWLDLRGDLLHSGATITAHNAMFDRTVMRLGNLKLEIPIERWRCTMVQALCHALPGQLEMLGKILGLPEDQQKLAEGKKLIQRFCKPAPSNHKAERYDRYSHPDEWQRFIEYGLQDITAMQECRRRMPTLNWGPDSIAEWHLDQLQNDRGFAVDCELVEAGARAAREERERLRVRFAELTHGLTPTQREKIKAFLRSEYGLDMAGTARHVLEPMMAGELHQDVREIFEIMLLANKTSTAKYAAMAAAVSSDSRFRGGIQYAGASRTRRAAGRVFQPHNLPSRGLPKEDRINAYIDALKTGVHDLLFDDLMFMGAAALRGIVIAPEGESLAVADLSNIEGRVLAWLAGEDWKLQAFRDYDAGTGPDLYNITAVSIIGGDPWNVAKKDRNVFGKVPDLAFGYQGGVNAMQTFTKGYIPGETMGDYWGPIQANVDPRFITRARKNWTEWGQNGTDLDETTWLASESVKLAWRARHAATVKFWHDLEDASIKAVQNPGQTFTAGRHLKIGVRKLGGHSYLLVRAPSGRYLCYFHPHLTSEGKLAYWGMGDENKGGKKVWSRQFTYGGKEAENITQMLARDVLYWNQPQAEREGFEINVHVHDEDVAEDTQHRGSGRLAEIMATNPPWAPDLPLAAAGFDTVRYRKD